MEKFDPLPRNQTLKEMSENLIICSTSEMIDN